MKGKQCHKCGKFGHFRVGCPGNKVSTKTNHVCVADRMWLCGQG